MMRKLGAFITAGFLSSAAGLLVISGAALAQDAQAGLHCQRPLGHHLMEVERTCPAGGETFTAMVSVAYSTYGRHLDWEPISYMRFPIPMPICPSNGFPVDREDGEFTPELIAQRMRVVETPEYQSLLGRHTTFHLYARVIEGTGENPEWVWWYHLQATWEADQCGLNVYADYAHETISAIETRLGAVEPDDEMFPVLNLIRINMHRRIGEFDAARALLDDFRATHSGVITENWVLPYDLLDSAITERNPDQVAIQEAE